MRILANYGYRTNGESFSVTFETVGDVPQEKTSQTVDELFRLAKEAVQRQVEGNNNSSPEEEVSVPEPTDSEPSQPSPQSEMKSDLSARGEAKTERNGNPLIKNPDEPATERQLRLIRRLSQERDVEVETDCLTKGEASELIDELMAQ